MGKSSSTVKSSIVPVVIAVGGVASMSVMAYLFQRGSLPLWMVSDNKMISLTFTIQAIMLAGSFLALILMYVYNKRRFREFFRVAFRSPDRTDNWHVYGPAMALLFTTGTAILMSSGVIAQKGAFNQSFLKLLPLVLLFAATNAWSEEIFSRFVIVAGLYKKIDQDAICWISAIIFGFPHFFGTPSGVFGVIMSGLLGWLLAKSVIETRSLGWAWLIHFLQDLMIFGAGGMIIAGEGK